MEFGLISKLKNLKPGEEVIIDGSAFTIKSNHPGKAASTNQAGVYLIEVNGVVRVLDLRKDWRESSW